VSDVLQVESCYVSVLAINVEVRRIIATLYMEGLPHIVATDMGRNMIILSSPKKWEFEALCKAKIDWLCYYF
jgi:hypothetical protein